MLVLGMTLLAVTNATAKEESANKMPADNPYLSFMNASLLTIYIRRKFLAEVDVLEHAIEISQILQDAQLDFGTVKEQPPSAHHTE